MFDELGIGAEIDQQMVQDSDKRIISLGNAVKAMVLNGLGFVNQRLYLVPSFFESKPTERLIGKGISPEHLNDEVLGRALDALYEYGVTELYSLIALAASKRLGLSSRFGHLDSSSFHVDGVYNSDASAEEGAAVIRISKGSSRVHRPELKQVVLELIAETQAGIPLLMKPMSGNSSEVTDFREVINEPLKQLQQAHDIPYLVADSALYNQQSLQEMQRGSPWLTRVRHTLTEAKTALAQANPEERLFLAEGYQYQALRSDYAGVSQRWLLSYSKAASERASKQLPKELSKRSEADVKALTKLSNKAFACRDDAEQALAAFSKKLKVCTLASSEIQERPHYHQRGRPAKYPTPSPLSYRLKGQLATPLASRDERLIRERCFILATNQLDQDTLPDYEVLTGYQGQAFAERGFRFLKDPRFLASSLFLKNPQSIMALMMVMTICLLVYAALQHRVRQRLNNTEQSFPDQKGKPTQRPTARWVFQCFVGIHLLVIVDQQQLLLNLKNHHRQLLTLLGSRYQAFYS